MRPALTLVTDSDAGPSLPRVQVRLVVDDLRLRMAEAFAEATKYGLPERFRQLAALGLTVEQDYAGRFLRRPTPATTARTGLRLPEQYFRVRLPPELLNDYHAWRTRTHAYAPRLLRLIEIGLLHEQQLTAASAGTEPHDGQVPALQAPLSTPANASAPRPAAPNAAATEAVIDALHRSIEAEW